MSPRRLLRLEGGLVLVAALAGYPHLGASWGLFSVLLLVPDLLMAGYLLGPRMGAVLYNAGHTYAGPFLLGAAAVAGGGDLVGAVALVRTAHIGRDRALGYGLKQSIGFRDTHLIPAAERARRRLCTRRGGGPDCRGGYRGNVRVGHGEATGDARGVAERRDRGGVSRRGATERRGEKGRAGGS